MTEQGRRADDDRAGYVCHARTVRGVANTDSTDSTPDSTPLSLALPIDLDRRELDSSTASERQQMKRLQARNAKNPTTASS